jgi:hypothetical protein
MSDYIIISIANNDFYIYDSFNSHRNEIKAIFDNYPSAYILRS